MDTTTPIWIALCLALLVAAAEVTHWRRISAAARLIDGASGGTFRGGLLMAVVAGVVRTIAVATAAWGASTLLFITPQTHSARATPDDPKSDAPLEHLVYVIDVSPSMRLIDAGAGDETRAHRATRVLLDTLAGVDFARTRVSVVPFFTTGKPAVVDTFDPEVARNAIDGLPFMKVFAPGETDVVAALRTAFDLAKGWPPDSTSVIVCTDGDSTAAARVPERPASIRRLLLLGVGSTGDGTFIDGHLSRQSAEAMAELATQVGGTYFNANAVEPPQQEVDFLRVPPAAANPLTHFGRREWALLATATGTAALLGVIAALALFDRLTSAGRIT